MESVEETETLEDQMSEANPDDLIKEETILTNVIEETEVLEWKCFVCDAELTSINSCSVFYTKLSRSGVLLKNSLNKVLRTRFEAPHNMRSPLVCTECINIFDELELAEQQCARLREILVSGYRNTCAIYNQLNEIVEVEGVSCQTENLDCSSRPNLSEPPEQSIDFGKVVVRLSNPRKTKTKKKTKEQNLLESEYASDLDNEILGDTRDDSDLEIEVEPVNSDQNKALKSEPDISEEEKPKKRRINKKKYSCDYCTRAFRRPGELNNHILVTHRNENPNQCNICKRTFNSRNGLYVHLKKIHGVEYAGRKQLVPGVVENVELSDIQPEEGHVSLLMKSYDESDMEDEEVERDADGSDSEWTEEAILLKTKPVRPGRKRSRRVRQFSIHSKEKENELHIKQEEELDIDEEVEREIKEEVDSGGEGEKRKKRCSRVGERATMPLIHECATCGKKWRTVSELNAHIQTHSDLRPFVCEICGQGYKMRKALDIHVGMHNGVHPFTCHFCNKSFTQKIGLQKHLPIHTGIARYQCDLCGKQFIHQKSFQIHKMVHSGEKSVRCNVCNMALLSTSHLRRHLRVHTGERPYECGTCGKRFAERYNLNAHQKIHLPLGAVRRGPSKRRPERGQKCEVCDFVSSRRTSLSKHWETEHSHLVAAEDNGYSHNSQSSQNQELVMDSERLGGLVPQMIIDPSGALTYQEKPDFYQHSIDVPLIYK